MNHSDEITFLNRLVEDLKESYKFGIPSYWIRDYDLGADRLNQATEVIARLEQKARDSKALVEALWNERK